MRCAFCGAFAIATFCKICSQILADPVIRCREVGEFKIYSFYDYSEIKNLIHSKHQMHGLFVYKNLANFSIAKFSRNFKFFISFPYSFEISSAIFIAACFTKSAIKKSN